MISGSTCCLNNSTKPGRKEMIIHVHVHVHVYNTPTVPWVSFKVNDGGKCPQYSCLDLVLCENTRAHHIKSECCIIVQILASLLPVIMDS